MPRDDARPARGGAAVVTIGGIATTVQPRYDVARGLRRRRDAALRLPPLRCGCHDPATTRHLENRCRWPRRWAA